MSHATCKLEVILDEVHLTPLLQFLDRHHAPGYTVIPRVRGKGQRGEQLNDDLTNVFANCYVLVVAEDAWVDHVRPALRKLLAEYGGMCVVSPCQWL